MITEAYHYVEKPAAPGAPLLFTFHGTGGNEQQFLGLAAELLPQAHVISPRGDVSEHRALRFFKRTGQSLNQEWLIEMVKRMLRHLPVTMLTNLGLATLVAPSPGASANPASRASSRRLTAAP